MSEPCDVIRVTTNLLPYQYIIRMSDDRDRNLCESENCYAYNTEGRYRVVEVKADCLESEGRYRVVEVKADCLESEGRYRVVEGKADCLESEGQYRVVEV